MDEVELALAGTPLRPKTVDIGVTDSPLEFHPRPSLAVVEEWNRIERVRAEATRQALDVARGDLPENAELSDIEPDARTALDDTITRIDEAAIADYRRWLQAVLTPAGRATLAKAEKQHAKLADWPLIDAALHIGLAQSLIRAWFGPPVVDNPDSGHGGGDGLGKSGA